MWCLIASRRGSTVSTDELSGYNLLKGDGYIHGAVDHSRKEWGLD
jgi:hypothetical protein